MTGPGPLMASGRDADIYAYGDGLVLRRSRQGRSMETEAKVMDYVRSHGYPVPAVDHLSDDGTDLVMERVDGPSMVEVLGRTRKVLPPTSSPGFSLPARTAFADWLAPGPGAPGESFLHLDLHPLNVLLGPSGPMVIDWTNARKGQADFDVALSWVLMTAGEIPGSRLKAALMGRARGLLVQGFLAGFDPGPVRSTVPAVVEWKVTDPHMSATEQTRMWALVARAEAAATG